MTLEDDLKNIKGRIREAIYEEKAVSVFVEFHLFCIRRIGTRNFLTYNFSGYISHSRFFIYCRPNIPPFTRERIANELERYIKECGGTLL